MSARIRTFHVRYRLRPANQAAEKLTLFVIQSEEFFFDGTGRKQNKRDSSLGSE
jgi:hypothetical protein